jgi:hypothetical protein
MPDPLVVQLAHEFREELVRRESQALKDMAGAWIDVVENALKAEVVATAEQLIAEHQGEQLSISALMRDQRARALIEHAIAEIQQYQQQYAEPQIDANQTTNALAGIQDAALLTQATADYFNVRIGFDMLPVEAVENIVAQTRAGMPLTKMLEKAYPDTALGLANLLIEGTAKGRNPRETARLAVEKGLSQGLNHFMVVARDQQIRAYRTAALQQYQKSGVVRGYRRLCAKQTRTCMACIILDGQEQDTDELMPLHRQDRCTVVPLLKRLPSVQFQTGLDWFQKQPLDVREAMMGPARYEAWKSGKFTLPQMVGIGEDEVWGPTVQVRPLKELLDPPKPPRAIWSGWKRAGGWRGGEWNLAGTDVFIEDQGSVGWKLHYSLSPGHRTEMFGTREEAILAGNKLAG